ncbi:MAG: hypothetical protein IJ123_07775 [Blautia sp.]|nr:hypothetical protein [Blautia sp.]
MSKINAVRFINLNYNHNTIRVSDETMFFNGESTLINLDNGGGKSVLVQMITAPFVQKRYRSTKERPFYSYFTSNKPTFILVEWILEQRAGFVLTGMMVRQNQKPGEGNDDELEMINFISEYKEPCMQDLCHLPVVTRDRDEYRLKSFAECRGLFDDYKRDRGIRFFSYDMNNAAQARQYFEKLLEYGINYREWQNIIKKVNEEESGLSKLFADCRDERGLVEKWFLDTIENKLNREQNRMEEFRKILEKYIAGYRSNEAKIKRRDIILRFEEEAAKIRENAGLYREAACNSNEKRNEIASYLQVLQEMREEAEKETASEKAFIEELEEKIRLTDHLKHSADYYAAQDEIDLLHKKTDARNVELLETEQQYEENIRRLNLLDIADRQEQYDTAAEDYQAAVQKLEVLRRRGEDLKPEREYIGYLLRKHFEEELAVAVSSLDSVDVAIKEKTEEKKGIYEYLEKAEREIRTAVQKRGELGALVKAYDIEEERYVSHWKADLTRNILGQYEPGCLTVMADNLDRELEGIASERSAKRATQSDTESLIRKLEDAVQLREEARISETEKLKAAEKSLAEYEDEIIYRKTVLQYLELREEVLFDKERILEAADAKIMELDLSVQKGTIEAKELEDEIHKLTTGQTVELTPELKDAFESLGLNYVYGMEWLKRNGKSEEENLILVEKNPFLPYALLMTEKEFEKFRNSDIHIYTSTPVPVVTRESLADNYEVQEDETAERSGVHFYMMFNQDLLNEERLEEILARKRHEKDRRIEETDRKRKEMKEYLERRSRIGEQAVSKAAYEECLSSIDELKEQLIKIREEQISAKDRIKEEQSFLKQLENEIAGLQRRFDDKNREKRELGELTNSYERCLVNMQALRECEEKLSALDREKKTLQADLESAESEIRSLEAKRMEEQLKEAEIRKQAEDYDIYQESPCPEGISSEILDDYQALTARFKAITENISHEEKEIQADKKKAGERLTKTEKELKRRASKYGFSPEDWAGIKYSAAEHDLAEERAGMLNRSIKDITGEKHKLEIECGKREESQKKNLEAMQRDCGTMTPLDREEVQVINYAEQKRLLVHKKKDHADRVEQISHRVSVYVTNQTALSEYQDVPVMEPVFATGDFDRFKEEDFRHLTGKLQKEYHNAVDTAALQQGRLEKALQQILLMEEFQDDYYRKPLETISALSTDAGQVLRQLDIVLQSYRDLMAKLMVDISVVEQERMQVVAALKEYAADVHSQMGRIDRNSGVTVRGKSLKMLRIILPSWDENEGIYQRKIEDLVDELTLKGISLLDKNGSLHDFVGKRMTTRELYDAAVGVANVRIQLYKIEAMREIQISWSEVARNSGGEGFLSAFIILSSLLYYMRRDETDLFADRNEGKVLLMDNPFAQTNASHLLKPMMEVAKKNNTQLICLTGLGGESIYNRFDNIYVLNLVESVLNKAQYLRGKHVSGNEPEVLSTARIQVSSDEGQMELMF